jgi:hypothetical protein
VHVRLDRPAPFSFAPKPDTTVNYAGEAVAVKL